MRALDLGVAVREFVDSLKRETDFSREARSVVLFRTALADVSIGDAFDSLLRAGSRNGVHNPGDPRLTIASGSA